VQRLGRRSLLNGLRGLAILMVLAFHAARGRALLGGYAGVDLFFVLSGFLITTLLIDEFATTARISLPKFYARRALRLFPALAPFLIASLVIFVRVHGDLRALMGRFLLATTFYCANFFEAHGHLLYWAHTWSLSAEEQFYLLWPALLILLLRSRLPPRAIAATTAVIFLLASLARVVAWRYGPQAGDSRFAFYSPFTHADGLVLGCLLGQLFAWNLLPEGKLARRVFGGASLAALAYLVGVFVRIPQSSAILYEGGFTLIAVACALLLLEALQPSPLGLFRLLEWRPLRYTGEISYGLYIWNPVFLFNYPGTAFNPVVATVLTFAVAAASFRWVEAPALRFKRRFAPASHQVEVVIEPAAPEVAAVRGAPER
jgi:peptidoglycan/LPS O-acetylase OafA/YrhL